jgi:hypothetical protein
MFERRSLITSSAGDADAMEIDEVIGQLGEKHNSIRRLLDD